ncbi:hypothetical protein B2J93_5497 [Marssonina coronariae]|uniref:NAD-dependent 15-hydroxyprostaglandin dehydrogenase n=1 Tax=Diplocarpon coronariae TaxID=2795749 RepID=A0A218YZI5_9HELO|nr:hypothetical protein B2J93_5497 [Marssonina coronariae]
MAFQVSGKTALITGAGSGICFEFAKLLVANKCNVVIADLVLLPEAELLVQDPGGNGTTATARAVFHETDVTDWKRLDRAFERALKEFGGLDIDWSSIWHPNSGPDAPTTNTYQSLEVNLTHPIRCTQLALDIFKRQGHGAVLLISSIAAQMALLPVPLYAASKAAISSFTRSLGPLEQHLNIRVCAVAPAIVETPIWTEERRGWVDESVDCWIAPRTVAGVMLDMVQGVEYVGGTVLEVGFETTRRVEGINDSGPDMMAKGYGVSKVMDGFVRTFGLIDKNFGK